jgi:hypothetical protein
MMDGIFGLYSREKILIDKRLQRGVTYVNLTDTLLLLPKKLRHKDNSAKVIFFKNRRAHKPLIEI